MPTRMELFKEYRKWISEQPDDLLDAPKDKDIVSKIEHESKDNISIGYNDLINDISTTSSNDKYLFAPLVKRNRRNKITIIVSIILILALLVALIIIGFKAYGV